MLTSLHLPSRVVRERFLPGTHCHCYLVCFITAAGQKRGSDHVFSDGGKGKQRRIDPARGECLRLVVWLWY